LAVGRGKLIPLRIGNVGSGHLAWINNTLKVCLAHQSKLQSGLLGQIALELP
jgi:hypothetical protein